MYALIIDGSALYFSQNGVITGLPMIALSTAVGKLDIRATLPRDSFRSRHPSGAADRGADSLDRGDLPRDYLPALRRQQQGQRHDRRPGSARRQGNALHHGGNGRAAVQGRPKVVLPDKQPAGIQSV